MENGALLTTQGEEEEEEGRMVLIEERKLDMEGMVERACKAILSKVRDSKEI